MTADAKTAFILVLAFVAGCSQDSTAPPDEEEDEDYVLETTQSVGSDGGTIQGEDFGLDIPPGAFDASYTLKLYSSSTPSFGDNQASATYKIEGIPGEYREPIQVRIRHDGALSDGSYLAHRHRVFDDISGDSLLSSHYHEATDSAGFLVGQLPAISDGAEKRMERFGRSSGTAADLIDAILLAGMTGIKLYESPNFKIYYPSWLEARVADLASLLENKRTIIATDFGFEGHFVDLSWPMPVHIFDVAPRALDSWGYDLSSFSWDYYDDLTRKTRQLMIAEDMIAVSDSLAGLDVRLGVLLFAFTLEPLLDDAPETPWLYHALLQWSGERFAGEPDGFIPPYFAGNELAPYAGMQAGAGLSGEYAESHGSGMSSMIKYLADQSGYASAAGDEISGLAATCLAVSFGEDPITALLSLVDGPTSDWWPDYMKRLVEGEIYGVGDQTFVTMPNLSGRWSIDDQTDTQQSFSSNYPDLSGTVYLIDLNYDQLDSGAALVMNLESDLADEDIVLQAFGYKDGTLEFWGEARAGSLKVGDLGFRHQQGWDGVLASTLNLHHEEPYQASETIALHMTIEQPPQSVRCFFGATVYGTVQWVSENGSGQNTSNVDFGRNHEMIGTITENTFEGIWEDANQRYTATIVLSPDRSMVTSFAFSHTAASDAHTYDAYISGSMVPMVGEGSYSVADLATCAAIDSVRYSRTNLLSVYQQDLVGYTCNDASSINIGFYDN